MRTFSSYGPVNTQLHYYAPRKELLSKAYTQLVGKIPDQGGHYITVWAPRQTGKSTLMLDLLEKIKESDEFDVAFLTLQSGKEIKTDEAILEFFVRILKEWFEKDLPDIRSWDMLYRLFSKKYFSKPVILILDEFDALREEFINKFANEFRAIYTQRIGEAGKKSNEKNCLLHGLALIGVRSVLGIENVSGSPFNVQRSIHIPNLTFDEVDDLFGWYEKESNQKVEHDVVKRVFYETLGQPGLTCWFGELLTETYNLEKDRSISMRHFDYVFMMAVHALPNNNILNIISKAKQELYKDLVLELFKTDKKTVFRYDDPFLNFLYMNGVTDIESAPENLFVRFSCPFVQKRLFNFFSNELFSYTGKLYEPFEDMSDTFIKEGLNIISLMRRFQAYLKKNREWLLKDAPKRKDMRIFEAVYHFSLYRYLCDFLETRRAKVWPEFPTGNGAVDIIIKYAGRIYALELKSYTDEAGYSDALDQAVRYGKQLELSEIFLVFFVEYIDDANREKYEKEYTDKESSVLVIPVFVETGN
ncbi:MAG: hypothetical protein GY795_20710 [Desulfobacterales bacterium]|nr:hypothetical protein [Desulfobacterales bacterium]